MVSSLIGLLSIVAFSSVYYIDFKILRRFKAADLASFSAGVGAVYVFIHMIPQLSHGQQLIEANFPNLTFSGSQYTIYLIALIGFLFFYGFDTFLAYTRKMKTNDYESTRERAFYWSNILFVSFYSMLIGYVVGSYTSNNVTYQVIYLAAYIIHFLGIKCGIYHVNPKLYYERARYPIILSLFLGYFIAVLFSLSPLTLTMIESLLTGAMILSVFKHELPNEKDSKSFSFTIGIVSSILLFMFL